MGRIKSLQPTSQQPSSILDVGAGLFSVRYRKLVSDDPHHHHNQQTTNNNVAAAAQQVQLQVQNLIRARLGLSQDYIAYCCGQCGHRQRLDIKVHNIFFLFFSKILSAFFPAVRNSFFATHKDEVT